MTFHSLSSIFVIKRIENTFLLTKEQSIRGRLFSAKRPRAQVYIPLVLRKVHDQLWDYNKDGADCVKESGDDQELIYLQQNKVVELTLMKLLLHPTHI